MLKRYLIWPKGPIYYIAGPSGMVAGMRESLNSLGVSDDDLKTEHCGEYAQHQDPAPSSPESVGHDSPSAS